jgi:heme ABC exporter ATP-binding subunit CcmA
MASHESGSLSWAVEIQGLTKSFGHRIALRGIDLRVAAGNSVAIFGPNGAGKTTLLKILATILKPSSGDIRLDGRDIHKDTEEIRRLVGVITHQTFLYSNLTAYENLDFYGRMFDVSQRRARIHEVLDIVGIPSRIYDRVGTLSRGMQQRISIARLLLAKPRIILLDEPETGLDQQATALLWNALREEGEAQHTILHTTHNLVRGFETCERMLILARGEIVFDREKSSMDLKDLSQAYRQFTEVTA